MVCCELWVAGWQGEMWPSILVPTTVANVEVDHLGFWKTSVLLTNPLVHFSRTGSLQPGDAPA